ncbi:hypothetical protein VTN00DRAFT_5847 [Thermoascus crustaceus]|uniref:uncharacterized protein n=1 Tax=Thermoascus crustaceus TaxID=5088 RepID=UPI0037434C39
MNSTKYHVLGDDEYEDDPSPKRASSPTTAAILMNRPRIFVVLNLILFAVSCGLLLARALLLLGATTPERLSPCKQQDLFYELLFPESTNTSDHCRIRRFDNSRTSIYRGPPSDEGDAAWNRIVKVNPFSIDIHTLRELQAPLNSTKLPESVGGGYMANLAVFHQLHCLKTIWQYTYLEYYKSRNELFSKPEVEIHHHLDHCVDLLRQALMCNPDTSIITFKSVEMQALPVPEYGLPRRCRDFEGILQWGLDHGVWPGAEGFHHDM